jgi:hypothetical protein
VVARDHRRQSVRNRWTAVLVVSWILAMAVWLAGVVMLERLGKHSPAEQNLGLLVTALSAVSFVAAVARHRVDVRALPWADATGPYAEFRGQIRSWSPRPVTSGMPFARLTFDDRHLTVRAPGVVDRLDRGEVRYVQMTRRRSGALVDVRRSDGTWFRWRFWTRRPDPVLAALATYGWPVPPR